MPKETIAPVQLGLTDRTLLVTCSYSIWDKGTSYSGPPKEITPNDAVDAIQKFVCPDHDAVIASADLRQVIPMIVANPAYVWQGGGFCTVKGKDARACNHQISAQIAIKKR